MTAPIKIDGKRYDWPTQGEWENMKPAQRRIRALRLITQAVRQEHRDKPHSAAINQALFLADDALGRHPDA